MGDMTYDDLVQELGLKVARQFVAQQVRGVQMWMALDLHIRLGHEVTDEEFQGHECWADWWSELLWEVDRKVP